VTPDGRRILSLGHDNLRVWDLASAEQVRVLGDTGGWGLAVSSDGRRAITGNSPTGHVWDIETGRLVSTLKGHTAPIWGVVLSADNRWAATGAWDGTVRRWDITTGQLWLIGQGLGQVRCLALSPDGKTLAAASSATDTAEGAVRLWDVATFAEPRVLRGHRQAISAIAFTPDGRQMVSGGFDATVRLWDVATGREVRRFPGPTDRVENVTVTGDGKRVIACGHERDPWLRVWDRDTGRLDYAAELDGGFLGLAVTPDGRHVVTTGKDSVVRLWEWAK
jgi:WD40 repeat protein